MSKTIILRLCKELAKNKFLLFGSLFTALAAGLAELFIPFVSGDAIDCIISAGNVNFPLLLEKIAILIILLIISVGFSRIFAVQTCKLANKTVNNLREKCFEKLLRLPLNYYDTNSHGDILSRFINDTDAVSEGILQAITQLFSGIITIVGAVVFMFMLNPWIALMILAITPLYYLIASFIAKHSSGMFRKQQKILGDVNGFAEEYISGLSIVTSFGYEEQMEQEFDKLNNELYDCGQKAQFYSSLVNPSTRLIVNTAYVLTGMAGVLFLLKGASVSVGTVSALLTYANRYSKPINELTGILTQLQTTLAAAERIFSLLDEEEESKEPETNMLEDCEGTVDFEHVKFSYVPQRPLITDLNLHVKPDSTVAIVGPTGSGKTTLVNLLMRFYELKDGKISIDSVDISKVSRSEVRSNFAMVLQETWLFEGTIRENIAFSRPDATDEEIIQAARAAHIHNFIEGLPDGYDTFLTQDGGNLSQGQRQLITIARAMLIDPPMLILDEATSSVDTRTELRIQRAFKKMMVGKTSFIIAHRLSTIRDADIILYMFDGDIVEQGTHEELLAKNGYYAKLYRSGVEE